MPSRASTRLRSAAALVLISLLGAACGAAPLMGPEAAEGMRRAGDDAPTAEPTAATAPAPADPAPATTSTTAATTAPDVGSVTSSSTSTSTSTSTTSTTSTIPPGPHLLVLTVYPEGTGGTLTTADGASQAIVAPWSGEVPGGLTSATFEVDGYNPTTTQFTVSGPTSRTVWLDKQGQLLHKVAEFGVEGAPKQVAFTPDNSELWVTLLNGDGVEVYDPMTGVELAEIDLPDAGSVEVIFNEAGNLAYVSQMETASVYEIDVATKAVRRNLPTNSSWTKVMVLSPDERTLFASNWVGDDVSEIDLDTGEVVRRLRTVDTPRGLYVTPDGGELWVAGFANGEIQVFDLATGESEVIYRSGGAMRHLVGDDDRGVIYASDMARHHALVVDVATREVAELAKVDRVPNTIDLSPDGRVLYVSNRGRNNPETYNKPGPEWGSVVVIDTATGDYFDALVGGNQPTGLDVSPDGSLLAYSDFLDWQVTTYEVPAYEVYAAGDGGRYEAHLTEIDK